MARFTISLVQITLLSVFCVLFSLSGVSAQTGVASVTGGSSSIATNGTYTVPSATSTSTGSGSTSSKSSSAASSTSTGAAATGLTGGNVVFGLVVAGAIGALGL